MCLVAALEFAERLTTCDSSLCVRRTYSCTRFECDAATADSKVELEPTAAKTTTTTDERENERTRLSGLHDVEGFAHMRRELLRMLHVSERSAKANAIREHTLRDSIGLWSEFAGARELQRTI